MPQRTTHLDRILGRLDDLDSTNLAILVQRLARERALLETVFNTIQEGILVINREGSIEYSNQAALRLIGLRERDVGQVVLWKVMPDLARSLNSPGGLAEAPTMLSREIEVSYPEPRCLRLYFVPLDQTKDQELDHRIAVILLDVTEQKRSAQEALESERVASIMVLAAGVAHEIGNPLNSINIHLQLIRRQLDRLQNTPARGRLEKSVEVCAAEVQRLDGIITHFLEAIRPQPPDLNDVDLLTVLTEVLEFQRHQLEDLGIRIEVEVAEALPVVSADRNQVKQVFFNIVKNAMEAMDRGGELHIGTRTDDQYVYLTFRDTGVGISPEDLPKVFQPYFSTKATGHGLGMMVVQRIMRSHGGQIGIDSRPGHGTRVTLQFPQKHRRIRLLQTSSGQA